MKTLFFLLMSTFAFAQVDLEFRDDSFILDNNKNLLKFDIKEPFYQIKPKGCSNFTAAAFDGGAIAYKALLSKYMFAFLNADFYTLNGDFTFTLSVDKTGKVTDLKGSPQILHSEIFFDDMQYVVRRIKTNWKPATCDGKPIDSQMEIKMNFSSNSGDL